MTQDDVWNFGRDVIDLYARTKPSQPALYLMDGDQDNILSFADIARISGQTADWLRQEGIGKGDRVLVVLGKHPGFWPIMVALNKLGAVAMPGTIQLTPENTQGPTTTAVINTKKLRNAKR